VNLLARNINDFFSLFFPEVCASCGCSLVSNEEEICTGCILDLPYTNFHLIPDNSVARQFWGRVPFVFCGAFLYFSKGANVQQLLHQFKYNNRPEIGVRLGEMYGKQLLLAGFADMPDIIIPVPLHPRKLKKRGYNQSDYFAEGLSRALNIPVDKTILKRSSFTDTQTKKSRFSRYENMKDVFVISDPEVVINKHVLLVDDIITTGATLEACASPVLEVAGSRISIAGIAYTN